MVLNIRQKQAEVVHKLLNFNSAVSVSSNKDSTELYKVFVLDKFAKDIIAPLLRVNDLRKHGITLHLTLESERQPIPDVPAIYLVQPTPSNCERIVQDAVMGLYEAMHLNFVSALPGRLMDSLAAGMVKGNCLHKVARMYDQYLAFIALESTLFSLGLPSTYVELNDPGAKDFQLESIVASIVEGLFSVFVTLGVVPVIRCPRGGAAEHIATLLDSKLRDNLKARNNLFSETLSGLNASLSRPLLCLFDRNFDLGAALQHTWTYKPLVHDVLGMKLNKVAIAEHPPAPSAVAATKHNKSYEVDDKDFFWEACGSSPFPKVAEEVEVQLQRYKQAVEEINKNTAGGPEEGVFDPEQLMQKNTRSLMSAVSSLPELQEKKKVLDKHTNLATTLLQSIKSRALDQFFNTEEDLLMGKNEWSNVLKLVQGGKGTPNDKLRIALLYLLSYDGLPGDAELAELENSLKNSGADVTALGYVRTLKRNNLTGAAKSAPAEGGGGFAGLSSQSNLLDWADKTFGQGISNVTKSVKSLLSGTRQAPVVVALESLMDGKQGSAEFESYAVFDPKAPQGKVGLDRAKGPFKDAVVFMIGGGNYLEREALTSWGARVQPPRSVVYGATDILSGDEFLLQLSELGRKSGIV